MIRSCCHCLGFGCYLAPTFATLDSLLESLLQAWDHFWSTLATFFEQKNDLRRQRCHQRCQREIFPTLAHFLGPHLGGFFARFLVFCRKSACFFHWDGFWSHFWGPVGDKCDFFVEQMSAKKHAEKRYPRKVKRVETVMSQGSLTAPLKSKIV